MTARCAICGTEHETATLGPKDRCTNCGARGGLRPIRTDSTYVPTGEINRPPLPSLACALEDQLQGRADAQEAA